jgi:hypothetical protein
MMDDSNNVHDAVVVKLLHPIMSREESLLRSGSFPQQ